MGYNRKDISKFIAYILRHNPSKFYLTPDDFGYIPVRDLLPVIQRKNPEFDREALEELVRLDKKNRYKIKNNKIRARYGHSITIKPESDPSEPPEILYHGTSPRAAQKIMEKGLKSMNRQYGHLCSNLEDARKV